MPRCWYQFSLNRLLFSVISHRGYFFKNPGHYLISDMHVALFLQKSIDIRYQIKNNGRSIKNYQ